MKKKIWVAVEVDVNVESHYMCQLLHYNLPRIELCGASVIHGTYEMKTTGSYSILDTVPKDIQFKQPR